MKKRQALTIIEHLAHKALNNGYESLDMIPTLRISDLKIVLREIRDLARETLTKGG